MSQITLNEKVLEKVEEILYNSKLKDDKELTYEQALAIAEKELNL